MAKIIFNDKNYNIDESALTNAINELKSHLSAVMNGEGATINLGGVPYSVDSTKLSTATTDFIAHLGTIAGSGLKVVVGGVEYGIDSDKVAGAISKIEAVLVELKSDDSDILAAGLYDANGNMTKSWDELLADETIVVEDGDITSVDDSIAGNLVAPNSIISIDDTAFSRCTALISIDLPNATELGMWAFCDCTALTSIDLPNATSIGDSAFGNCTALTSIDLPNATSIDANAFRSCTALTSIDLLNATEIGMYAFRSCTALTSVDLPNATSIDEEAFHSCTALSAIILSNTETVCDIVVTAAVDTKILTAEGVPTGEGFIYVPTKFYETYVANLAAQVIQMEYDEETATNIATAILRKIEDFPEICNLSEV